jgi:hypothetical protein
VRAAATVRSPAPRVDSSAALINIRPSAGNRGMEVQDPGLRERIRALTSALIGRGEPL